MIAVLAQCFACVRASERQSEAAKRQQNVSVSTLSPGPALAGLRAHTDAQVLTNTSLSGNERVPAGGCVKALKIECQRVDIINIARVDQNNARCCCCCCCFAFSLGCAHLLSV